MIDYIPLIISILIVITIFVLIVKFVLNPLFFSNYFSKDEILNFLKSENLYFISHKKIKVNTFKEDFKEDVFLTYRTSFFEVKAKDKEGNIKKLKIRQSKSNSLFHKNKIEFYFE